MPSRKTIARSEKRLAALSLIAFVKELHNSVLYRNAITKASIRDKTIIPQYYALIQLSKDVITEINKITKSQ